MSNRGPEDERDRPRNRARRPRPPRALPPGITVIEDAAPELEAVASIQRGLHTFNQQMGGQYDRDPVTLLVHDEQGRTLGGLLGLTFWGWLFIDWLWLTEEMRGHGVGEELLRRAETLARERGCTNAYTDTFSFQAPGFWSRCGYEEFGRLDGMPPGHARLWYRKAL